MSAAVPQVVPFLYSLSGELSRSREPEIVSSRLETLVRKHLPGVRFGLSLRVHSRNYLSVNVEASKITGPQAFFCQKPLAFGSGANGEILLESFSSAVGPSQWLTAIEVVHGVLSVFASHEVLREKRRELAMTRDTLASALEERKLLSRAAGLVAMWHKVSVGDAEEWLKKEASRRRVGLGQFAKSLIEMGRTEAAPSQTGPAREVAAA